MTTKNTKTNNPKRCFLCDRPASPATGQLIEGARGMICKTCADTCVHLFSEMDQKHKSSHKHPIELSTVPSPREIKDFLDQYVIGQEQAKKVVSVAVHSHYTRVFSNNQTEIMPEVELDKSNVLLIGPTGTGKTLLAQVVAKMLQVPCAISDATTVTEAGYVGADIENILLKLYQAANANLARTEIGIVVVDEIDKKSKKDAGVSITRDVSGEGVQSALLKIIEGCESDVPLTGGRKHPGAETIRINTKNILFILCGAFIGLDKIVETRLKGKGIMGFSDALDNPDKLNKSLKVTPEDLIAFGLIPELVGRIPVVSSLEALSEKDLLHILTEPRNAVVKQYIKMAKLSGASLSFSEEALVQIAHIAFARGTGARGLRSIVEDLLLDFMFDIKTGSSIEIARGDVDKIFGGLAA
jgi:ATP-dependent Clp protease ATP-binding subunit ClpX